MTEAVDAESEPESGGESGEQSDAASAAVRDSKFLSGVLRHNPGKIGIELDAAGWVDVDVLLAALKRRGRRIGRARLDFVVEHNNKKRFEYDESGTRIRASQGHSVPVELGYEPTVPPETLYHGTATRSLDSIFAEGLVPGSRHHVHLSMDVETATKVGSRHGKPAVLRVAAARMHADGQVFFRSTNGVWLTEHVAPDYLTPASPTSVSPLA
ncbi:RNA 2'-phosphotransferase [Actinospica sp.]|uniref:RNA 2'-phosphotransferase n=1 Tax=Actinospica sp. TaxID=1872142 RepID=UPI002B896CBD|nr:RNA 2'-phosphotransferase [Actinospica sp.]HWG24527.1 RNA 2'-phosphotransferase [Actinospica sp.]